MIEQTCQDCGVIKRWRNVIHGPYWSMPIIQSYLSGRMLCEPCHYREYKRQVA